MANNNHGALGSNQKLERVPFEPQPAAEEQSSKDFLEDGPSEQIPTSPAIESKDDGDVVYLREDLRPGR